MRDGFYKLLESWKRNGLSSAEIALRTLEYSVADSSPPPEWAVKDVVDAWRLFSEGVPVAGWVGDTENSIKRGDVPKTLGDAFGIKDKTRPEAKRLARMHWYGPQISDLLQSNDWPVSDEGFARVAGALNITESQARDWHYQYRKFIEGPPP